MFEFVRRHYKAVIWLMIISFFLTLIPSVIFLVK
jgi:hypothetical protein